MYARFIPALFLSLSTFAIAPFIVPAIAYQHFTERDRINASIHFDSNNLPIAKQPNDTEFLLTKSNQNFSLANCNCQVKVYDFRDRAILHSLRLTDTMIDGKAAIATKITFPDSGSYTVAISGQVQSSNEPFEIRFPVTAVNLDLAY